MANVSRVTGTAPTAPSSRGITAIESRLNCITLTCRIPNTSAAEATTSTSRLPKGACTTGTVQKHLSVAVVSCVRPQCGRKASHTSVAPMLAPST